MRAWSYYEWASIWGGVPLITKVPQTLAEASQPRSSVDAIYTFIIGDLTAIQAALPISYTGVDVGRVTKGAAQALLARVYMNKGDYAAAKTELLKVYNSNTYSLMDTSIGSNFDLRFSIIKKVAFRVKIRSKAWISFGIRNSGRY